MKKLGLNRPTDWEIRVARDEKLTSELLQGLLKADSCCVDIGANIGDFLEQFARLAPDGKHLAFEPIPQHAAALTERFPEVEIYECALSNRDGQVTFFYVPNRDAWSGLQKQQYPDGVEPVEITVDLKRLDDIIGSERLVDFVKIDVEGAEYEVLLGAKEILKRCSPVVLFEHAKLHNEHYGTTPEMIFDFFEECGMGIWDLALSHQFDRQQFLDIYAASFASNYARDAQTNFLARPVA